MVGIRRRRLVWIRIDRPDLDGDQGDEMNRTLVDSGGSEWLLRASLTCARSARNWRRANPILNGNAKNANRPRIISQNDSIEH